MPDKFKSWRRYSVHERKDLSIPDNRSHMNAEQRKALLQRLREYLLSDSPEWLEVKERASVTNRWFTPEFIDLAVGNIANSFLTEEALSALMKKYDVPQERAQPKKIGIVMAGNIPLVGFHDLICCFLSGHYAQIKLSSKDDILPEHLVKKMIEWEPAAAPYLSIQDRIQGCDAYITTGSDNTARYFEHYFGKYPHIIRRNRTSVAVITGEETAADLEKLADDVHQYFGLGCRNVTRLYVPQGYDFVPLLEAFKKYAHFADHYKFRNNYDYHLAIQIMNNKYYMTNNVMVLVESEELFSPISQLNYTYYTDKDKVVEALKQNQQVQAIVGYGGLPFGQAQCPAVDTFADGVDTMAFLRDL